jgi:hypothetical protein
VDNQKDTGNKLNIIMKKSHLFIRFIPLLLVLSLTVIMTIAIVYGKDDPGILIATEKGNFYVEKYEKYDDQCWMITGKQMSYWSYSGIYCGRLREINP